uniref:Prepilin-type N-terminal cleavage/methylation domain protein n=1 Tax=uncultured marine microorganism HF4000_010L19 TaxID=455518 RepID=B3T1P4_9ZZZZ|nr:hypothetical protein ALOHA_HF4000010L19ctg1g17 [uncultured marine microorganism HF4000_010L19]
MKRAIILGFTLVETLVAIVIGVISVAALFYSYQFFAKSYQGILDKASISRSGRDALTMIAKDLRNAGYKDVNYTPNFDRWIEQRDSEDFAGADFLAIYYNTSPNDRVRIYYRVRKYRDDKNSEDMYLSRDVVENPVTNPKQLLLNEIIVPYVTDFQVVLKDIDGKELKPVCIKCNAESLKHGTAAEGKANQSKVHTAEVYLTVRSPNKIYQKDKIWKIINYNAPTGRTQTLSPDRYHRETFFTSVYLRNIVNIK